MSEDAFLCLLCIFLLFHFCFFTKIIFPPGVDMPKEEGEEEEEEEE